MTKATSLVGLTWQKVGPIVPPFTDRRQCDGCRPALFLEGRVQKRRALVSSQRETRAVRTLWCLSLRGKAVTHEDMSWKSLT